MIIIITSIFNNASITPIMFNKYIEGLKSQTVPFGLVIVDDCGSDRSCKIIRQSGLPVVQFINNKENIGLTKSLIKAVQWTKENISCDFLVCHDADDYSYPDRLEKQLEFMNNNYEIDVLNSSILVANAKGKHIGHKTSIITHKEISKELPKRNVLFHSAVLMRRRIFDKVMYQEKWRCSQDYGLWIDCLKHGFKFAGIDVPLLTRCKHKKSVGMTFIIHQRRAAKHIRKEYQEWLKTR